MANIFANNGCGFLPFQTISDFNMPILVAASLGAEIIGISDLNHVIVLRKDGNGSYYKNQTIICGLFVATLTISGDSKYLMIAMQNGTC